MFEGLLETLQQFEVITLYRHTSPDCDALGSQWGLASWLKHRFPSKQIYVLGAEKMTNGLFPDSDSVDDATISRSLAIILDTANVRRIDDSRWKMAARRIHLDHHPQIEHFAEQEYVLEHYAATCEILAEFFFRCDQGEPLPRKPAEYLYRGLLTDTLCFRTSNTTDHTLSMAAYLARSGLDIPQINRDLFDTSLHEFQFAGALRNLAKEVVPGMMITIVDQEFLDQWQMSASQAKDQVYLFGNIREIEIWAVFARDHDEQGNQWWSGSLRSKSIPVNDIAMRYRGGGHRNAAGCKCLDDLSRDQLIQELAQRLKQQGSHAGQQP